MSKLKIGILDYGAGNLGSLQSALLQIELKFERIRLSDSINNFDYMIIPGVGSFNSGMKNLENHSMVEGIIKFKNSGKKILGICLGMHLLASVGSEGGTCQGLNLINGRVDKLEKLSNLRVPHLGWDMIYNSNTELGFAYFAHSYYLNLPINSSIEVESYFEWNSQRVPAIVNSENVKAFQFHPEKSGEFGLKLLRDAIR
jgi:glutamine amidotransferase